MRGNPVPPEGFDVNGSLLPIDHNEVQPDNINSPFKQQGLDPLKVNDDRADGGRL